MNNHELFARDPRSWSLANDGVARVKEPGSPRELAVLRSELETFVCEGRYADGVHTVVQRFLGNIDRGQQPGVWVSGFYGSGKSHFAKMLRALWVDLPFPEDGASARGIVPTLPPDVAAPLRELSLRATQRKVRLHAASGTLNAGAGNLVRPAILKTIFDSLGFAPNLGTARFELWLQQENHLKAMKAAVEAAGKSWEQERDHFLVSPIIAKTLLSLDPHLAESPSKLRDFLKAQFSVAAQDVSSEEMITIIRRALANEAGELPFTLLVLDEVQQFIHEDSSRAIEVQDAVEALQRQLDSRLIVLATGQSAMSSTAQLERIHARFTVEVQLHDQDVEAVIQKVVLLKKPAMQDPLRKRLDAVETELARHLPDATIRHRSEDHDLLLADYPILPSRWRLWDRCLRAVDRAGVTAKLRNQLKLTHEAARATAELPIGHVVGADFIIENQQTELLNTGILPREIHEKITRWQGGAGRDRLKARLGALCFLLARLPRDPGGDIQVYATASNLTDLLVTDLDAGAKALRGDVDAALREMIDDGDLMLVGQEYRWQTRESASWHKAFQERVTHVLNNTTRLQQARADLLKEAVEKALKKLKLTHGQAAEKRDWHLHLGEAPPKVDGSIPVWLRDGWTSEFETARSAAQALGVNNPTVVVFLPKLQEDALRKHLAERDAATAVVASPPLVAQSEGSERNEARDSMVARGAQAQDALDQILREITSKARIVVGGGTERPLPTTGEDVFYRGVDEAVRAGLDRLYPDFGDADSSQWDPIAKAAQKGSGEAFAKQLAWTGDLLKHRVVDAVLKKIGGGRTGKELRADFTQPPYGWPQDAVDATLYTLLVQGQVRASDNNAPVALKELDRKRLALATFKREKVVATMKEKGAVKALVAELGVTPTAGQEAADITAALNKLSALADAAGGEAPRPGAPDRALLTKLSKFIDQELIVETAREADALRALHVSLTKRRDGIIARLPGWERLGRLLAHARDRVDVSDLEVEVDAIRTQRLLLQEPDPVAPLAEQVAQRLRDALNLLVTRCAQVFAEGEASLAADAVWQKLTPAEQDDLRARYQVSAAPTARTASATEVLQSLDARNFEGWQTLLDALPTRFQSALGEAARRSIPQARRVPLITRTLSTPEELDAWLADLRAHLAPKLGEHPVIVG